MGGSLHNIVNILNTPKLSTFKGLILLILPQQKMQNNNNKVQDINPHQLNQNFQVWDLGTFNF